jgi:hypothetical protein
MGSFQTYGNIPRAIAVVDRSLRETAPGVYSTSMKLPASGNYDIAFLIDNPLVDHCFDMDVKPDPAVAQSVAPLQVEYLSHEPKVGVGEKIKLQFRATDPKTKTPKSGLEDIRVFHFLVPGIRQDWIWAKPLSDGFYEAELTFPEPGFYYVFLECPSLGIGFTKLPSLIVQAVQEGGTN